MDPDASTPGLLLGLGLLAANAFFVAAEFALISVRRTGIEQLSREGDAHATRALPLLSDVSRLALAAQLGRSVASILLGYAATIAAIPLFRGVVPDGTVYRVLGWRFEPSPLAAVALALLVVIALHVVLGTQVPKILGAERADWVVTRLVAGPLRAFAYLAQPALWALSRAVEGAARLSGARNTSLFSAVHTPDEIRMLVAHGHEHGMVEEDEREMIHGVLEFSDTVAREVMTPRTDMIAVPVGVPLEELIELVAAEGHSRLPVYDGTIDSIVGILLVKDLIPLVWRVSLGAPAPFDLKAIMREPYFVPDTKPVDDILAEFRQQSVHLAIVLDEFGGTYGLLTMEDLLEEIVGEINDEYDVAEPEFSATPEGDVLIDGGAAISEVNERFAISLPEADFDTIGGYIFGALGRVPEVGDRVDAPGAMGEVVLQVEELEERRITCVRLIRSAAVADSAARE